MRIGFALFKPGASRADYGLDFDLPAIPQQGDKIIIRRPDTPSNEIYPQETFVVRRTEWSLKSRVPHDLSIATRVANQSGSADLITVECELLPRLAETRQPAPGRARRSGRTKRV